MVCLLPIESFRPHIKDDVMTMSKRLVGLLSIICILKRTFAAKSSYGEIFFISPLELVHKVLTPKTKKNGGHRLCFGENGGGKMP